MINLTPLWLVTVFISCFSYAASAPTVTEDSKGININDSGQLTRYPFPTDAAIGFGYVFSVPIQKNSIFATGGAVANNAGSTGAGGGGSGSGGTASGGGGAASGGSSPMAPQMAAPPPSQVQSTASPTPQAEALPSNVNSLLYRANQLFNKKKFEEAMTVLDRAEEISPNNARVKTMKGSLFYKMGWKDLARENWENSLQIDPKQPEIKGLLDQIGRTPAKTITPDTNAPKPELDFEE